MGTVKAQKLVSLGRPTAAITFTRNNNRVSNHVRSGKQAREGNHPALLRSLILPCLVSLVSLVSLGIAAAPAHATETFGIKSFENTIASNSEGALATQAGSHPYALTTTIIFNHEVTEEKESFEENLNEEEVPLGEPDVFTHIDGNPRDLEVNLPAGLIVNPAATSVKCTEAQLETSPSAGGSCPAASAVGVATVYVSGLGEKIKAAIYNMAPPPGIPAELGVDPGEVGLVIHIVGRVRTGGDYGFSAEVSEIAQTASIYGLQLTLWGDPSSQNHDGQRGVCAASGKVAKAIEEEFWENENRKKGKSTKAYRFSCPSEGISTPLLTMPGACAGKALETTLSVDSWQETGDLNPDGTPDLSDPRWQTATSSSPPVTGCEHLDFSPSLEVTPAPRAAAAESPTGLNVDLSLPHEESVEGLAGADLRKLSVTLPPGMAISLSAANGLGACTNTPEPGRPEGEIALHSGVAAKCPESSELGEAEVRTPLLEEPLKGAVYLAQPETFEGSLIGLYVVVEGGGVTIKLAGKATLDPSTGQVSLAFNDLPQLPLNEVELSLFSGPRAALVTPPTCGTYTTTSQLTPWSAGWVGSNSGPATTESENLEVDSGPDGAACPSGKFGPSFTAGATDTQAGAFTPFSLNLSRQDGEQRLAGVQVAMPPGLLGIIKGVTQCPEPQASEAQCSQASAIGTTTVGAGPGEDPLYLPAPGRPPNEVYLTGPYNGSGACTVGAFPGGTHPAGGTQSSPGGTSPSPGCAPFGLSIVVPAIAGPFDLGEVVIRAKVEVDPHTAAITVTSDPLPIIEEGIPLDIRTIAVNVDRGDFMFNPTNCTPRTVAGAITSGGAGTSSSSPASSPSSSSSVSSPFQAAGCASLPFKPVFSAQAAAKASKAGGVSLVVRVGSKGGPQPGGGEANIEKVKVDLPKQLPSRLTTLQQACPAGVFAANPAACPTPSQVGTATASAPMLAHSLVGPAYLVSHGGLALPDLVIVLRGEGIVIDLEGQTSIKRGITSSTFRSLPDAPISSFEVTLPEGKYSALAANGNLCEQKLVMPTEFKAQNGAEIKQNTHIEVEGCPNTISISSHKVKGKTTTLSVYVPAAGKLTATGKGLSSVTKTYSGQEAQTFTLTQKKGGKLKTKIKLTFTPSKGKKQSKTITISFKK